MAINSYPIIAEQVTRRPSFLWVHSALPSVTEEVELVEQTSHHSNDSHSDDQSFTSAPGTPIAIHSLTTLSHTETTL